MISGDQLARGGISAVFPACESGVSEDKWKAAFEDYDSAAFLAGIEAEAEAYQERKIQRQREFEAKLERRDRERQAVITAPEVSSDEQLELRFGSRVAHVEETGILSSRTGKIISEPGN
jgi:hypothetical protein